MGKSGLISRNITVDGHRTSIRLEAQMWTALKDIAERESCSIHDICGLISSRRSADMTLTASIRIFLMLYYKAAATEDGHAKAGHGGFHKMLSRAKRSRAANDPSSNHSGHTSLTDVNDASTTVKPATGKV